MIDSISRGVIAYVENSMWLYSRDLSIGYLGFYLSWFLYFLISMQSIGFIIASSNKIVLVDAIGYFRLIIKDSGDQQETESYSHWRACNFKQEPAFGPHSF